jgi:hypothetical protein
MQKSGNDLQFEVLNKTVTHLHKEEHALFFHKTIPFIQKMVLETPKLFPDTLDMLVGNKTASIKFTREQCCCVLANSFFCSFLRPSHEMVFRLTGLPSINLDDLFCEMKNPGAKIAKIYMIFNYFKRMSEKSEIG